MSGGHPQQYQRHPPPQQYQQQQQYGEDYQYRSQPRHDGYNNGNVPYDNYRQANGYRPTNQYAQTHGWDGYHESEYQDEQLQPYHRQPQPRQDFDQRQERAYQYDNRYRSNGQGRPTLQSQQSYEHAPSQPARGQRLAGDVRPRPKERERILKPEPESPTTVTWDNPFGAFPTKKEPPRGESSRKTSASAEKLMTQQPGPCVNQDSHPSRNQPQHERPQTAHSQRSQKPPSQEQDQRTSASRQELQRFPGNGEIHHNSNLTRSPPQRAMTGPLPRRFNLDTETSSSATTRHLAPLQGQAPRYQVSQDDRTYSADGPDFDPPIQPSYQVDVNYHVRRSTDEDRHTQTGGAQNPHAHAQAQQFQSTYSSIYDEHASVQKPPPEPSPEIPNFDAMSSNNNEDQLGLPTILQPAKPYRKATYDPSDAKPPANGRQTPHVDDDQLSHPMAQFSFDLPSDTATLHVDQTPTQQNYGRDPHITPIQRSYTAPYEQGSTSANQHPPRSASRGDMRPLQTRPQEQPPIPVQHGRMASPSSYQQPDSYNTGRPQRSNVTHTNPGPGSAQINAQMDPSRSGFDPRLRPQQSGTPQPHQQQIIRPHTSNSVYSSLAGHDRRSSSDSYQYSIRSNVESRPVPIRPGLMQPTPQPPTPVEPSPVQRSAHNTSQVDKKITPQELNILRDAYRTHPDDHALGLRFAKKLVEASKVLINDNGRADPKTVARNRERYVLDAHKVVKKLVASGYTEAMFYMADCYGQGLLGLQPDPKEAFALYQSAAKLGHSQSAYRVAVCCELGPEEGGGTRRDPLKAMQWYKRAASLGDTPAMYKMGMVQIKGLLGQPRNPREGISWLKRAAERADEENPHALHELGLLYESAQSTDVIIRDEKYALQLFTQAAELGYKYSQFKLGSAYEYGLLGCIIEPRMSIAWYSKAAAQGEHQSEFALSGWYLTGSGQPGPGQQPLLVQSDSEAYLWARKAASSGLAKAEYAMGYYTETGIGTAVNVEEAKKWYFRAAAQNHPKARERLEALKRGGARMQKTRVSRSNVGRHNEGECSVM